ncbi:hypothetical protein MTO96_030507 [Rhipicephalus appendiculatus]
MKQERGDGSCPAPFGAAPPAPPVVQVQPPRIISIEMRGRGYADGSPRVGSMPRVGLVWFLLTGLSRTATANDAAATTENCTFATCSSDEVWNNFLPSNYSKSEPPVVDGMAVLVNVSMKIVDVDDINEERMDFRLHTYIEESWRDGRLRTSPYAERWRRMSVPRRVARLMWTPDVVFSNTKRSSIFRQSVDSVAYKIARDGSVHRLTRQILRSWL